MKIRLGILMLAASMAVARAQETVAQIVGERAPQDILRVVPDVTPPNLRLEGYLFVGGYEAIGQPVALSAEQVAKLAAVVKDPAAFNDSEPEAKMRPGVSYRFGTGKDAVNMLVCFSCDKVGMVPAGQDAIASTAHITQPTREVLLALAKELLPTDEAIQELPKVRSVNAVPPPAVPIPKDLPKPGKPPGEE